MEKKKNNRDEKLYEENGYYYYKTSVNVDKINKILKEYYNIEDFNFVPIYIKDTNAYGLEKINNEYVKKMIPTEFSLPNYNITNIEYDNNLVIVSLFYDSYGYSDDYHTNQNGKLILKYNNGNFNFEKIEFEN